MLAGGVLAAGVRPAATLEDELYELAAHYDYFGRAYGFDYWTVKALPDWLQRLLPQIGNIRAEIEKEQAERNA